jgi:hypothetical protein
MSVTYCAYAGEASSRLYGLVADDPEREANKDRPKIVGHGRYVSLQMAEVAVPRNLYADILRLIAELRPPPVSSTGQCVPLSCIQSSLIRPVYTR